MAYYKMLHSAVLFVKETGQHDSMHARQPA